jgi:hypothetical protein
VPRASDQANADEVATSACPNRPSASRANRREWRKGLPIPDDGPPTS